MLRVEFGGSVPRRKWQRVCQCAPRVVGVIGEPGAVVHIRYDQHGFIAIGQGCSESALYAVAKAVIDAITAVEGQPPLPIWGIYPNVSVQ